MSEITSRIKAIGNTWRLDAAEKVTVRLFARVYRLNETFYLKKNITLVGKGNPSLMKGR